MREKGVKPIAGIDFGSNSLRLAVARTGREHGLEVIHRERAPVRLANDAFGQGEFSDETLGDLVNVSGGFVRAMEKFRTTCTCNFTPY